MRKKNPLFTGYSLLEILVVITILSILAAISVSTYLTLTANNNAYNAAHSLSAAIQLARSSALANQNAVSLCGASDPALSACGAASTTWNYGWIVFNNRFNIDNASGGSYSNTLNYATNASLISTADIIQKFPISNGNNITINTPGLYTVNQYGMWLGTAANLQNVSITITPSHCTQGQQVQIQTSGNYTVDAIISSVSCP